MESGDPSLTAPKKASAFHLSLGERGEMIGWGFLVRHGYKILEKNYRCPLGEADVIAAKKGRLIFVEIKTRAQSRFGAPQESVQPAKQEKIIRVAQWYLKDKKYSDVPVSFHVLAIQFPGEGDPEIRLIEDAFSLRDPDENRG